jgi:signal transduction histidine kinase/CheY-like chemotaxis protein
VCFALHVREIARTGLAQPPVFAVPGPARGAYPVVGGLRLERGLAPGGLAAGDRLLRVGEVDLAGVGHVGFDAIALEQAGTGLVAPIVYERDGERRGGELRMLPYPVPWFRIPMVLGLAGVGVLLWLRAPGTREGRLGFAAYLTFAIFLTPILGGPRIQTMAHHALFLVGGPLAITLGILWFRSYPPEMPRESRLPAWIAVLGLVHGLVRVSYLWGGPIPPARVPELAVGTDVLFGVLLVAIVAWNYAHAEPIGRRRLKWFLYAVGLFGAIALLAGTVPLVGAAFPELRFPSMVWITGFAVVLLPIGLALSFVRYNLVDIDRLLVGTAAYLSTFVAVSGAALLAVPLLSAWLAAHADTDAATTRVALAVGVLAVVVPLGRALHHAVARLVFRDRHRRERDMRQLLRDLPECREPGELLRLVDHRLREILRLSSCLLFVRDGARFCFAGHGEPGTSRVVPDLDAHGPLARALERHPVPLLATARSLEAEVPELSEREATLLETLDAEVLVPLRERKDLEAIVVLGPKRSGDITTAAELALLRELSDRGSAELGRLAGARALELERGRSRELAALKRRAEEANMEKTRFLAAASHDLRQPLHALGFFTAALAEQVKDPAARETLAKLETSARALQGMMDKLLDLSRLDASALEPEIGALELEPLLRRLVAEHEGAAAAKGLALRAELVPCTAKSDPVLLARIVSNLLSNAIRYTEAGEVALRSTERGAQAQIDVADTGPGIPEERRRQVFEEFVRLQERKAEDGLGLGLSIVERLAKLLGHELTLRSEVGVGSTFSLRLARLDRAAAAPAATRSGVTADLSGATLLLVDDDAAALDAVRELSQRWGCEVIAALDVEAALGALDRARRMPDAIVADYRLGGGVTGLDAIARIRARLERELPAVVVTGETTPATLDAIRAAGLRRLAKPVPPHKLRAVLSELLRR